MDGCDVPFAESPNTTTEQAHRGLSSAAKAGIGVGVSCGVLLVAAGLIVWFKRRRSKIDPIVARESPSHDNEPNELSGEQIFELNAPQISEMPVEKESQEMATKPSTAELRAKSSLRIVSPQELEGDHP